MLRKDERSVGLGRLSASRSGGLAGASKVPFRGWILVAFAVLLWAALLALFRLL
ncbi:hypothetical protein SAMN05216548_12027 [Faunimonas pinastri]|uniref:Uncharacterized protein n=1 Tax=Faunimonas pinastri TaxID=1855383 RepID=A0A1H9PHD7_9HYPH|nr:hypothetical protein [Faunimonas pinastri]SER47588.1 hypothetical protein SAMN05216548_12027 [Faunimonas pinastri]